MLFKTFTEYRENDKGGMLQMPQLSASGTYKCVTSKPWSSQGFRDVSSCLACQECVQCPWANGESARWG